MSAKTGINQTTDENNKAQRRKSLAVKQLIRKVLPPLRGIFQIILKTALILLLVSTIAWWGLAAIIWPAEISQNQVSSFELSENSTLTVISPQIAPVNSQPGVLEFMLQQEKANGSPLILNVIIPDGLRVVPPSMVKTNNTIELSFSGDLLREEKLIYIGNGRVVSGWNILDQTIGLQVQVSSGNLQKTVLLDNPKAIVIGVEGTYRGMLRQIGGGGDIDKTPLFPLATILVSVAGLVYQEFRNRRKRQEDEHKRQEDEKKIEQQQQLAKSLFERLRQFMKTGRKDDAKDTLDEIHRKDLAEHLEKSDLTIVQRLINLMEGNSDKTNVEGFGDDWIEEAAATLIYAAETNPTDRTSLSNLLRGFPEDRLRNDETRRRLQKAREVLGSDTPIQARDWPTYPPDVELPLLKVNIP